MKLAVPPFWKNASPKQKRIYSTLIIFVIAVLFVVIGSYVPISHQDANSRYDDINQTVSDYGSNFGLATESIFLNNFQICLLMFIPVAGPIMGLAILLNTGISFGAIAAINGYPVVLIFINMFLSPIFWLEFAAYSIAITESIWLLRRLIQGQWRELKITGITIGICAALLIIGALVEAWLILY